MDTICDICGIHLSPSETCTVSAAPIVKATASGYVPEKLPASWKVQCELLDITIASHWKLLVETYSKADWGLCKDCLKEVEAFNKTLKTTGSVMTASKADRQLWHLLLVWSHPDSHDLKQVMSLIPLAVPGYSAQSKPDNGKVGAVWITEPVESYDLEGTAASAFGDDIRDTSKYELEEMRFAQGKGAGRCLVVYRKLKSAVAGTQEGAKTKKTGAGCLKMGIGLLGLCSALIAAIYFIAE